MAKFILKREVCVFYIRKILTKRLVYFKPPLVLSADLCMPIEINI